MRTLIPKGTSPRRTELVIDESHLNEPLSTQFTHYIFDCFTFDLHTSVSAYKHRDINSFIWKGIAFSLLLFVPVFLASTLVAWLVENYVYRTKRSEIAQGTHALALILAS